MSKNRKRRPSAVGDGSEYTQAKIYGQRAKQKYLAEKKEKVTTRPNIFIKKH